MLNIIVLRVAWLSISGVPKVTLLAIAEVKGEGGKTSAIEVEAKGEAEGLVFCIYRIRGNRTPLSIRTPF